MRFFNWIGSFFENAPINRPVSVRCDHQWIYFKWGGSDVFVNWSEIEQIYIRTTDHGPFDDDVFIDVETAHSKFSVSQAAPGASQLLAQLQELPGFNNEAVLQAMGCTDNKIFLCWKKIE